LAHAVSVIATGSTAPMAAAGKSDEEAEKRLDAALLAGDAIVCVDNAERPLGGARLCQAISEPSVRVRRLPASSHAAPCHIAPAVAPIRHRPALADHPGIEVEIATIADGYEPAVLIALPALAANRIAADSIRERHGRLLTAAPGHAVAIASLPALGRVYAVTADALAVDFERVAVRYRGGARQRLGERRHGEEEKRES